MIRFGPAGIPLSCKGRTLKDGIEDVHNLGLTAIEIPMVRAGTVERYPEEEEIGSCIRELTGGLVVEIIRDDMQISDPKEPIEDDDILLMMASGVADSYGSLIPIGNMARRLDVKVSLHTPYYMDLGSNNELTDRCINNIRHAGIITNALGGNVVVTNLGLYKDVQDTDETDANIIENIISVMEWWKDTGIRTKLGVEITGRLEAFGSLDQILELCDEVDGIVPVVNFPHYHSRTRGSLNTAADFKDLLDAVEPYCKDGIHTLFSGVEHFDGNERRLTPIKKGDLKFEPLGEALADMKHDVTVISGSPLLEHDAMYMKVIHERVLTKRVVKAIRAKKKDEAVAAAADDEDD
ncbi:MAG: TIM barrel protein [Methanomassiliicoccaceae archaeon]|jgi:deoxyribonuclease-4|nr:TIM barrel protein [Methanomassiliicoccaceae archaeon]